MDSHHQSPSDTNQIQSEDNRKFSRSESPSSKKYKRNYRACLNCRVRKVKCDLGSVDNPRDGKCARCLRERKDCVFVESRRGGSTNVMNGRKRRSEGHNEYPPQYAHSDAPSISQRSLPSVNSILNEDKRTAHSEEQTPINNVQQSNHSSGAQPNNHFSTMEGALVFLAKAAGTIAKADERDNIDAREKHEQIEARISNDNSVVNSDSSSKNVNDNNFELTAPNNSSNHSIDSTKYSSPNITSYTKPLDIGKTLSMPAESGYMVRPKGSNKLGNIEYIGGPNGILTEDEAQTLIHLFFTTMHPYFPYIPKFLHSPTTLSGYPILLCAILTIASRHYTLDTHPNTSGVARNIEVHDRLWLYVQRLISQTVWAEASTRSIGTVFAFLLFTEWNPRAIHWRWSDYANKAEDINENNSSASNEFGTSLSSTQDEPNLAGLGAMRRSYRMAWMLIGSAVRLAQDMGFMEISTRTFLATHIAEINSVMNISRRSMLGHSLSEIDIDDDEITEEQEQDEEENEYKFLHMNEEELQKIIKENVLKFTLNQRAKIELLQIMSLGHESLYGHKAQLGSLTQRQNLSILSIISPLLNNWSKKYKHLLVQSNQKILNNVSNLQQHLTNPESKVAKELADVIDKESFIFEFHYAKLYIFSLALSPSPKNMYDSDKKSKRKSGKFNLKLDEISRSAKYIEQAFNSANEMLSVAHRIHKLKMLRFMPVRWVTRIVRAVAFIVKCYLTITAHKKTADSDASINSFNDFDSTILSLSLISIEEITESIQRAAITLRDCSPDELHLCTRYSNVLMYLCSEMKVKAKVNNDNDEDIHSKFKKHKASKSSHSEANDASNGILNQLLNTENYGNIQNEPLPYYDNSMYFNKPTRKPEESKSANMTPNEDSNTPLQGLMGDSEVMDWFINNKNVGLDFVGPWTEMIEQQLNSNDQFNFGDTI